MSATISLDLKEIAKKILPKSNTIVSASLDYATIPASYIIYKDGNVTRVKNGITGQIEYSGDDTTAIQYAINSLADTGGRIFLKTGIYYITNPIDLSLKKGIMLEGESYGWGWVRSQVGTILRLGANVSAMIKIDNSSLGSGIPAFQDNPSNIVIRGLQLDGRVQDGYSGKGIYAISVGSLEISDVYVHSFSDDGIHLANCAVVKLNKVNAGGCSSQASHNYSSGWYPNKNGIHIDGGAYYYLTDILSHHNREDGLLIESSTGVVLENVHVEHADFAWNDKHGIEIKATAVRLWIVKINSISSDENGLDGIHIEQMSNVVLGHIWITNAQIFGNGALKGTGRSYGIYIKGYSNTYPTGSYELDNIIMGNKPFGVGLRGQMDVGLHIENVDGISLNNVSISTDIPTMIETAGKAVNMLIYGRQLTPFNGLPLYTSLPSSAPYAGASVLYFDGANYYIAVWNGSAWKKVQLT